MLAYVNIQNICSTNERLILVLSCYLLYVLVTYTAQSVIINPSSCLPVLAEELETHSSRQCLWGSVSFYRAKPDAARRDKTDRGSPNMPHSMLGLFCGNSAVSTPDV